MAVLVVGPEKNVAAVRSRLTGGSVSSATAKRINAAFRQANPGVDLDDLRPGTILVVPAIPELAVAGELSLDEGVEQAADAVLANASQILDGLVQIASSRAKEASAERRRVLKAMDGGEVREAADKVEGLAEELEAARAATEAEQAADTQRAAALKKARAGWAQDLTDFRELVRQVDTG